MESNGNNKALNNGQELSPENLQEINGGVGVGAAVTDATGTIGSTVAGAGQTVGSTVAGAGQTAGSIVTGVEDTVSNASVGVNADADVNAGVDANI